MAARSEAGPAALDPARIFQEFDFSGSVVAAVSGGSDSLAMLLLLERHLAGTATRIVAATVDHGLRPGSAEEARQVAAFCGGRGIAHVTLRWDGPKPVTGLPAAARMARYRLLAKAAGREGAATIVTGHTRDDQIETVLMRAKRGGGRGLAGMAPATLYDGHVWIARPLLGTMRADLRAMLAGEGVSWVDDPTNADQAYERARLRAGSGDAPLRNANGFQQASHARIALGLGAASMIETYASMAAPGLIRLERSMFEASDRDAAIYAFRVLLAQAGGAGQIPDHERVAVLHDKLAGPVPLRVTLSRTVVDARRRHVFLYRERRDLPLPALPVDRAIWDGRYRLGTAGAMPDVTVAPLGLTAEACESGSEGDPPGSVVRAAYAAEPAMVDLCGVRSRIGPSAAPVSAIPVLAPWALFLPSFDLAPAQALGRLVGAKPVLLPPLRGHIGSRP